MRKLDDEAREFIREYVRTRSDEDVCECIFRLREELDAERERSAAFLDLVEVLPTGVNDALAVDISRENADLNKLTGAVDFYVGDLVTGLAGRQCDLLLANIQADVLMKFARELSAAIGPSSRATA